MEHCRECGDRKPLNRGGVCRWRGGCEHRQMQHEARMARLNAELARLDPVPLDESVVYPKGDPRGWASWQDPGR